MHCRVVLGILVVTSGFALAQEAAPTPSVDWREEGSKAGLTNAELDRLGTDKVLVSRHELKQSFSAYLEGRGNSFLTSDAVLNAYHVLFEETLRQREEANVEVLRRYLMELWNQLATIDKRYKDDPDLIKASHQRARFIVGVAALCMNVDVSGAPEPLRTRIADEVTAIGRAEGQRKPELLGVSEPEFIAFDYTVFRPAGFYTGSPRLEGYFRAVRWLQLVPFRTDKREELLAWHMMNEAMDNPGLDLPEAEQDAVQARIRAVEWAWYESAKAWKAFGIARGSGAFAESVNSSGPSGAPYEVNPELLQEASDELPLLFKDEPAGLEVANDRIRDAPQANKPEREARLIAALTLPEYDALRQCREVSAAAGPPCGLEMAAWLGLPLAETLLRESAARDRMTVLAAARPSKVVGPNPFEQRQKKTTKPPSPVTKVGWEVVDEDWGVCWAQMHALRGLWEPDKRLPAFMLGEPWQRKTLLTVTSSWAQHRHAWSLQSKLDIYYLGMTDQPKALVEPVPEFFQRLADVCDAMAGIAKAFEAQADPVTAIEQELAGLEKTIRAGKENTVEFSGAMERLLKVSSVFDLTISDLYDREKTDYGKVADVVATTRKRIAAGDKEMTQVIASRGKYLMPTTSDDWSELSATCLRLALLSHKQLDLRAFSASEYRWLRGLGSQLAHCMQYDGNSYLTPLDDAPRIARISSDPRNGSVLHAGIGRPRLMYVLYPWKGEELLCQGVVMPYHEMTDKTTLTDEEWRAQFRKGTRPGVPPWLKEFVPVEGVKLDRSEE